MSSGHSRLGLTLALALAVLAGVATGTTGCANPPCIRHSDCNVGLICAEGGVCVEPPDAAPEADADLQPDAAPGDANLTPDANESIEEPDASDVDAPAQDGAP